MTEPALASARLRPIAGRGPGIPDSVSDGVVTSGTYRLRYATVDNLPVRAVNVVFGNYNIPDAGTPEIDGANAITIKASLEHGGVIYPLFIGGYRSATLQPGETVVAELHPRSRVIAGEFFIRVYVSVASAGMTWPWFINPTSRAGIGEGNTEGAPGTDLTERGAGAVATASAGFYCPNAVLGEPLIPGTWSAVAFVGDSNFRGADSNSDAVGHYALLPRWLNNRVAYVNNGRNGDRVQWAIRPENYRRRTQILRLCAVSDVLTNYGINDLKGGRTDSEVRADLLVLADQLRALFPSARLWLCTLPPNTSSTDAWATVGNQTKLGAEAGRLANNAWRRTVPRPFFGCIEQADAVETARDSGFWVPGYTSDGLHVGSAGCAAGAAVLGDPLRYFARA